MGRSPEQIRFALSRSAPELDWPLHTAYFNMPVLFALGAHIRALAVGGYSPAAIVEALQRADPSTTANVLAALRNHEEPPYKELKMLDALLREFDSDAYTRLRDRVRDLKTLIRSLLAEIAHVPDTEAETDGHVFGATERHRAQERGRTGGRTYFSQRYDMLLGLLLAGVVRSLEHRGGSHHVFLQVLTRDTIDPVLDRSVPLHNRHVAALIAAIPLHSGRVRLTQEGVPRFDADVHPALVLADFIATTSRTVLASGALPEVEQQFHEKLGLRPRSGKPPRTHLSAAAPLQLSPGETFVSLKPWALSAAAEWQ
jgi:hypothetical protein